MERYGRRLRVRGTNYSVDHDFYHTPVLLLEVVQYLLTSKDGIYFDATLGGGGHGEAILEAIGAKGKLIGIDVDTDALNFARRRLSRFGQQALLVNQNFQNLKKFLRTSGIHEVRGTLFDLGISSHQIDETSRGFSFRADEQLDMRMDRNAKLDAYHVVNRYTKDELTEILWKYGEEKFSRRIASAIVLHRVREPVTTTGELAQIVKDLVGERFLNKTLARVFQAIRIEVNKELERLNSALTDAIDVLTPGGRIVVISYHSLEDRIVKETFKAEAARTIPSGTKLAPDAIAKPRLKILTKKPLQASEAEIHANPRARSAKLRAAEKI